MIVDFDDFHQENNRLDLLWELRRINPLFKCTLFAVPGRGDFGFWESIPRWCELAVHGWTHKDSYECANWTHKDLVDVMSVPLVQANFVRGFKAPGWQISDECLQALAWHDWWVADQPYNDKRRPLHLRTHRLGDFDHWHGHIQNECGNGLEERFKELSERVAEAETFRFVSEVVKPWRPL